MKSTLIERQSGLVKSSHFIAPWILALSAQVWSMIGTPQIIGATILSVLAFQIGCFVEKQGPLTLASF